MAEPKKPMKDYKWQMYPDTIFEARRMTNGQWVRGQVIGETPFVYILTHENYRESVSELDNSRGESLHQMRLIRVIANSVRKVDQFARESIPEDKNDVEFGVGDIVRGKSKDGFAFDGRIFHIDIKKEGDKLHPIMFVSQLKDTNVEPFGHVAIWVSDITELEILHFKEEDRLNQRKPGRPYMSPEEKALRDGYRKEWTQRFPDAECPLRDVPNDD